MSDETEVGYTDINDFEGELTQLNPFPENSPVSPITLDNVASHDFAYYQYRFPPEEGFGRPETTLSDEAIDYIGRLERAGMADEYLEIVTSVLTVFEESLHAIYIFTVISPEVAISEFKAMISTFYSTDIRNLNYILHNALRLIRTTEATTRQLRDLFEMAMIKRISRFFPYDIQIEIKNSVDSIIEGVAATGKSASEIFRRSDYDFEIFPYGSVNLGLRLVYRQEWSPLGIQPGEIVRTIPLGPGQVERVTTKITRRRKRSTTREALAETERTFETSRATEDSSEIIEEAKETSNWSLNAEVNATFGFIGGSVSAGGGGSSEEQSKDTSKSLSSTMEKTAAKVRQETKVIVSMESEEQFEKERYSEIRNPNNEIAITYEYLKLQQQYEVYTRMAEAHAVILVAERVPTPLEVNAHWVQRYHWIISKALLDEAYRSALNSVIQDVDDPGYADEGNPFSDMLGVAQDNFARFQTEGTGPGQGGLSVPDIYSEPQRIQQEFLREDIARRRENSARNQQWYRFFEHLRDNILHYCREIWRHEDLQQRLLRYRKENRQLPSAIFVTTTGRFIVDETVPLWEVIDSSGPIGFSGNYAVFQIRADIVATLSERIPFFSLKDIITRPKVGSGWVYNIEVMLSEMLRPYNSGGQFRDPALDAYRVEAEELHGDNPNVFRELTDATVSDIASYLPQIADELIVDGEIQRDESGALVYVLSTEEWAEYQYRKNGTRRFLIDSNNLYLRIRSGEGAALEPFKRAHRYLDVLKVKAENRQLELENLRYTARLTAGELSDPDIEKKIIVEGDTEVLPIPE